VALLYLSKTLEREGQFQGALGQLESIVHRFADTPLERLALFEQVRIAMLALRDAPRARQVFSELQRKYPHDDLTRQAQMLLGAGGGGSGSPLDKRVAALGDASQPLGFALSQNYPNPFNPSTVIQYRLPQSGHATLTIYNLLGEQVITLVNELKEAGSYSVRWDGRDRQGRAVANGVYVYQLGVGDLVAKRKMLYLK